MGKAKPEDTRWLVVYKRLVLGQDAATVSAAFEGTVSPGCQEDILERFRRTGDVQTWQGKSQTPLLRQLLASQRDIELMQMVIDDPKATLPQHAATFLLEHGKSIHVSVLCRAMKRIERSYGKVCAPCRLSLLHCVVCVSSLTAALLCG